jgi:hypothetical protein
MMGPLFCDCLYAIHASGEITEWFNEKFKRIKCINQEFLEKRYQQYNKRHQPVAAITEGTRY